MFLRKYSITMRIAAMVGSLLLVMLVLAAVEIRGLDLIRARLDSISQLYSGRVQLVQKMRYQARHSAVLVRNILLLQQTEQSEPEFRRLNIAQQEYEQLFARLREEKMNRTSLSMQETETVATRGAAVFDLWQKVLTLHQHGEILEAMQLLTGTTRSTQQEWLDALNRMVDQEEALAQLASRQAVSEYERIKTILIAADLLAFGAGIFFIIAISAGIVRPLREMGKKIDLLAAGDYSVRVVADQRDELGILGRRINHMAAQLQHNAQELGQYRQHLEEMIALRTRQISLQREQFLSVLIHDLKAPLVPIVGFSRLLMTKAGLVPQKIHEYAAIIHNSASKLSAAIERTSLELKDHQLGEVYQHDTVDLKELLASVVESFQVELSEAGLSVSINGDNEQPPPADSLLFTGDSLRLTSLMENLLTNAMKYARQHITITLRRVEGHIYFSVGDDGKGVDPAYREEIFTEYFQAPGARPGLGLGLYSVQRIVDYYHGKIELSQSPEGGAMFTVTLPLARS